MDQTGDEPILELLYVVDEFAREALANGHKQHAGTIENAEPVAQAFFGSRSLRYCRVLLDRLPQDRDSVHRLTADESYEIAVAGRPVSTAWMLI